MTKEGSGSETRHSRRRTRRFAVLFLLASGGALSAEDVQVNTYTTSLQLSFSVAMRSDGTFVVVWDSYGSPGSNNDGHSIQAQSFDANAAPSP